MSKHHRKSVKLAKIAFPNVNRSALSLAFCDGRACGRGGPYGSAASFFLNKFFISSKMQEFRSGTMTDLEGLGDEPGLFKLIF